MTVETAAAQEPAPASPTRQRNSAIGRWARRGLARWRPILLTILLVASTGFATGYFFSVYRTDWHTDDAARNQAIAAASDGAVALLSYSPETLARDFTNAKSRVTENYLPYYQQFADQIVGPSAQRGQVTTTATVVKAAVSEMQPDLAVVLVFVKQKTASKVKPQPVVTSNSLKITMKKVNNSWLIEKFEGM
jgi:Mce-associated membrane protein